jgi:hypothetical protein
VPTQPPPRGRATPAASAEKAAPPWKRERKSCVQRPVHAGFAAVIRATRSPFLGLSWRNACTRVRSCADGLPSSFHAERYLDTGSGEPRLLPWSGDYADYRRVGGLLVPHHFSGYWHVDGQRIPYVDFILETPEYDVREPFS